MMKTMLGWAGAGGMGAAKMLGTAHAQRSKQKRVFMGEEELD